MALKTLKLSRTDTQHTQKKLLRIAICGEKKYIFKKYLKGDSKKG